jgi:formylglycine-generating enzyme required for sulfatase activity
MRSILALAGLLLALPAHGLVTVDWVEVGTPGNAPDHTGYGAVPASFWLARVETTNAQYAEFLNAVAATDTHGLYNPSMGSDARNGGITRGGSPGSFHYDVKPGFADLPVVYVSFYDGLRFANWLHNEQPTGAQGPGTTEDGAYTITPARISANSIGRNAAATIHLPNENEWYKAAYFDGAANYFEYPAGVSTITDCTRPGGIANTANCDFSLNAVSETGAYVAAPGPHGSFDQGGNLWEWNESVVLSVGRGLRGGSFIDGSDVLAAVERIGFLPTNEVDTVGFRVARSVPEPSSPLQIAAGLALLAALRGRAPSRR